MKIDSLRGVILGLGAIVAIAIVACRGVTSESVFLAIASIPLGHSARRGYTEGMAAKSRSGGSFDPPTDPGRRPA